MYRNKICGTCGDILGFMYIMTLNGYRCLSCQHTKLITSKEAVAKLPAVEDIPPVDGKYRLGIIATDESSAKLLCDSCYELTPSFTDLEN